MTTAPSSPGAGTTPTGPTTVRARVREAIEAAWVAAVEAGALPPVPDDQAAPEVEVARPAKAEHGD